MKVIRFSDGRPNIPWTPDLQRLIDLFAFGRVNGGSLDKSKVPAEHVSVSVERWDGPIVDISVEDVS